MAKRKYVKENNLVKAINTDSLELQKPLVSEYYDINVHNSNMDKIDTGYRQNKNDILDLKNTVEQVLNYQTTKVTSDNGTCIDVSGQNANDINKTGFYMGEGMLNVPSTPNNWVYIESKVHNEKYRIQVATELHNSSNRWTRHRSSSNGWSDWKEISNNVLTMSPEGVNGWEILTEHSRVRVCGSIVSVNLVFVMGSGVKSPGTTIAQIDSKYAPKTLISTSSHSSTNQFVGCFDIKTTGSIKVSDAISLNEVDGSFGINVTYMID